MLHVILLFFLPYLYGKPGGLNNSLHEISLIQHNQNSFWIKPIDFQKEKLMQFIRINNTSPHNIKYPPPHFQKGSSSMEFQL